jgi:3-phosphoshikimate 1-carboxyvinyltransferase
MTNRALVLATLAEGTSIIRRPLHSRDTQLMADGVRALGATVTDDNAGWVVTGRRDGRHVDTVRVDVGNAGTVARFLPAVAALGRENVFFDGDQRIRERPLGELLRALATFGADIDDGGRGSLPLTVHGHGRLTGGTVDVDATASSQLISGLLLSAPRFDQGARVRHIGSLLPSAGHIAMTVAMLRDFGAEVSVEPDRWQVEPGPLSAWDVQVEPDLSSAAPFLAAAVVTGGRIRIPEWPLTSTQPGARLPQLLQRMGADCTVDADGLTVHGARRLVGLDDDLRDVPELVPVLAAVAAVASTASRFAGIAHLRGQETDRLAALARELSGLGADVQETPDGLLVRPRRLTGGRFATYDDHRLAMAAAVVGLVVPGVEVENVATTGKTLPGFVALWSRMLEGVTA